MSVLSNSFIDSVGQRVGDTSSDIITAVSEVKIEKDFTYNQDVKIVPNLKIGTGYDMKNDNNNAIVGLSNGASYTSYGKALSRFEFSAGMGAKFEIKDNIEISLDYLGKFRTDYYDHTGMLTAKYKF